MAKKNALPPTGAVKICGRPGCKGALRPRGTGLGCMNPACTNYWEKWIVKEPVDERAAMLAAIRARRAKGKTRG